MNILIVDDEPLALLRLNKMIEKIPGCRVVGSARTGLEAIQKCHVLNVDLVLMDIRLPGMDGIQASLQIRKLPNPPAIIITTAYAEFTLPAYSIPASGYLLKPITSDQLATVLSKAQSLMNQTLHESLPADDMPSHSSICCFHRGSYEIIPLQKIYYLEVDEKYTYIFHQDGSALTKQSLHTFVEKYPEYFLQIHRKIAINRTYLRNLHRAPNHRNKHLVTLFGVKKLLGVSRRNLPLIRAYLKSIFGKTQAQNEK